MITPTPRSTLFPYTTLFRSLFADEIIARRHIYRVHPEREAEAVRLQRRVVDAQPRRNAGGALPVELQSLPVRDRKSTRLNSSHANISYAVFCLKKKKK